MDSLGIDYILREILDTGYLRLQRTYKITEKAKEYIEGDRPIPEPLFSILNNLNNGSVEYFSLFAKTELPVKGQDRVTLFNRCLNILEKEGLIVRSD